MTRTLDNHPTRSTRSKVIVTVLAVAVIIGGIVLWHRHQEAAKRQACVDAYAYALSMDDYGYRGELREPGYLADKARCVG